MHGHDLVYVCLVLQYGEIEEMNICDNLGDHLVGNVYVKVRVTELSYNLCESECHRAVFYNSCEGECHRAVFCNLCEGVTELCSVICVKASVTEMCSVICVTVSQNCVL